MLNMMNRGFLPYQAPSGGPAMMRFMPYGDSAVDIDTSETSMPLPPMQQPMQPPMQQPMFMQQPVPQSMFNQGPMPMFGQPFSEMNFMGARRPMRSGGGPTRAAAMAPLNMMLRRSFGRQSFGPRTAGLGFGAGYGGGGRGGGTIGSAYENDFGGAGGDMFSQTF